MLFGTATQRQQFFHKARHSLIKHDVKKISSMPLDKITAESIVSDLAHQDQIALHALAEDYKENSAYFDDYVLNLVSASRDKDLKLAVTRIIRPHTRKILILTAVGIIVKLIEDGKPRYEYPLTPAKTPFTTGADYLLDQVASTFRGTPNSITWNMVATNYLLQGFGLSMGQNRPTFENPMPACVYVFRHYDRQDPLPFHKRQQNGFIYRNKAGDLDISATPCQGLFILDNDEQSKYYQDLLNTFRCRQIAVHDFLVNQLFEQNDFSYRPCLGELKAPSAILLPAPLYQGYRHA